MNSWVSEVNKISKEMFWEGIEPENRETFKGDALELLTEFLMKTSSLENNEGLLNYKNVRLKDDYGVDATGEKNGVFVVVQCKFRSNPLEEIFYADLARTFCQGIIQFGLDKNASNNLWLVTTCQGPNRNAMKILKKHLHVINFSHLKKKLNGNIDFWNSFYESVI